VDDFALVYDRKSVHEIESQAQRREDGKPTLWDASFESGCFEALHKQGEPIVVLSQFVMLYDQSLAVVRVVYE